MKNISSSLCTICGLLHRNTSMPREVRLNCGFAPSRPPWASQHFHAQGGLDGAKPQFNLPAPGVELGEVLGWILLCIQQRGDQRDRFGPIASSAQFEA